MHLGDFKHLFLVFLMQKKDIFEQDEELPESKTLKVVD